MVSKEYLENLAGMCSHLSSFGSLEYGCINNFSEGNLRIHVVNDYERNFGEVHWQERKVFSYQSGEEQIWIGRELSENDDMIEGWKEDNWETKDYFNTEIYTPGDWEDLVDILYAESTKNNAD